jgi:hypothetical protein
MASLGGDAAALADFSRSLSSSWNGSTCQEIKSLVQPLLARSGSESVRSNNIGAMKRPEEFGVPLFLPEWRAFEILSP